MKDLKTVVTGGEGFLGRVLVRVLRSRGWARVISVDKGDYDLTSTEQVRLFYKEIRPDIVIHLAAIVGGIGANSNNPGRFFYENAVMGIHVIEEGRLANIEKMVLIGTICAYPKFTEVPFKEENLWNGYPEETNAPYGLAKKMLLVQSQAYRQQYGFNSIYLLPVNMYGPGDNFNPESSHVIAALIRKCTEAVRDGLDQVEIWGTGKVTREFIYVEDAALGIAMAAENYNGAEPVNIGAGFEITIADLAVLIADKCRFTGKFVFNSQYPDGQPRRSLDTSRARELFGFEAHTSLSDGIAKTVEWYKRHVDNPRPAPFDGE